MQGKLSVRPQKQYNTEAETEEIKTLDSVHDSDRQA